MWLLLLKSFKGIQVLGLDNELDIYSYGISVEIVEYFS
jgi:hypothetical protein